MISARRAPFDRHVERAPALAFGDYATVVQQAAAAEERAQRETAAHTEVEARLRAIEAELPDCGARRSAATGRRGSARATCRRLVGGAGVDHVAYRLIQFRNLCSVE